MVTVIIIIISILVFPKMWRIYNNRESKGLLWTLGFVIKWISIYLVLNIIGILILIWLDVNI